MTLWRAKHVFVCHMFVILLRNINNMINRCGIRTSVLCVHIFSPQFIFCLSNFPTWWIENNNCQQNVRPYALRCLTHWSRVTNICVGKLTTIGSDKVLSPGRRQAIIWTNANISLIGPLTTNFSVGNLNRNSYIFIQWNAFENFVCDTAAILSRPLCGNLRRLSSPGVWSHSH